MRWIPRSRFSKRSRKRRSTATRQAPAEPSLEIVPSGVSPGDCKVPMVNGWTYCDVPITLHVALETPALPAGVACTNMGSQQTVPLEVRQGELSLTVLEVKKKATDTGPDAFAWCDLLVNGVAVVTDSLKQFPSDRSRRRQSAGGPASPRLTGGLAFIPPGMARPEGPKAGESCSPEIQAPEPRSG